MGETAPPRRRTGSGSSTRWCPRRTCCRRRGGWAQTICEEGSAGGPSRQGSDREGTLPSRSPTDCAWRRSSRAPSGEPRMQRRARRRSRRSGSPCSGRASACGLLPALDLSAAAPPHPHLRRSSGADAAPSSIEDRVPGRRAGAVRLPGRGARASLRQEDGGRAPPQGTVLVPGRRRPALGRLRDSTRPFARPGRRSASSPGAVEVLGLFDDMRTAVTNFVITPVLGLARGEPTFHPDGREIERVIEIPLAHLLQPDAFRVEQWEREGVSAARRLRELRGRRGLGHHRAHPAPSFSGAALFPGDAGGPGAKAGQAYQ